MISVDRDVPDREARNKITRQLDTTFLVEAGAGSGKTRSLVDRMIACLRTGACKIENLAAVTFTLKAAAELRERFQTGLEKAYADTPKETERRLLGRSLRALEQCFIGTIHAFCGGMLRERPIEISLMPDFRQIEEIEDAVFREECWLDFLTDVRWERPSELAGLEKVGLQPEDLKSAFDTICEFPELRLVGGRDHPPDFAAAQKNLEIFLRKIREVVPRREPGDDRDDLEQLAARLFVRQRIIGFEDPVVLAATLEDMDRNIHVKKTRWPDRKKAEAAQDDFEDFRSAVVRPFLQEWREYRHPMVIGFLKPAVRYFYERRKRRSLVNFTDMLLSASELLRENPAVRSYFQKKYTHILVDEFQDTDPIQAEVLMYLTGMEAEEKEWRHLTPRPGSLFLVGDPKQSIYRFRRADIDTYNLVRNRIIESGGEVVRLTSNFRSLKVLADWNNPIFESCFVDKDKYTGEESKSGKDEKTKKTTENEKTDPAEKYQAVFAPLNTVRTDTEGTWSGVYKITGAEVERHRKDLIAAQDAERIADWIQWAVAGNVQLARTDEERAMGVEEGARPEDFMVLFRYKKGMDVYARALEERGIPYEVTGSRAFGDSEDIREIAGLARALKDPDNPVLTVGVLRGVFFGVSDLMLWEFKKAGGRFSLLWRRGKSEAGDGSEGSKKPDEDPAAGGGKASAHRNSPEYKRREDEPSGSEWPEGALYVADCLDVMRKWWRWTRELPASVALGKIFEDSGIVHYLASLEMGSSKAGNALKLLEHVRGREVEGETTFAQTVRFLEELIVEHDVEEMSLTPGRADAVRLMNLHKAKGLEAPVVFLANPKGTRKHLPDRHVVRFEEGGAKGFFRFEKPAGIYQRTTLSQPVGWEQRAVEENKYAEAEEDRLMYVASTRAKNMLVVSTYAGKLTEASWELLDGFAQSLPELNRPGRMAMERKEKLRAPKAEVERAAADLAVRRAGCGRAGYVVETVTALAKAEGEIPWWSEAGRGMSWGRVVHALLEAVGRGGLRGIDSEEIDRYAGYLLKLEDRDLKEKEPLLRMVKAVTESEFWGRMQKAGQAFFEVPFSLKVEGREALEFRSRSEKTFFKTADIPEDGIPVNQPSDSISGAGGRGRPEDISIQAGSGSGDAMPLSESAEEREKFPRDGKPLKKHAAGDFGGKKGPLIPAGEIPVIVSGIIDLIFREPDGWVIVDYKSDETGGDIEKRRQLIDYYTPQVRLYSRFWERITGEPVKESGLYFTAVKRWVPIG